MSDGYLSLRQEAAAFLGVAKPTLYAYVSRGLVRSQPGADSRVRTYNRLDLEQLRARKRIRNRPQAEVAGALQWGAPLLDSSLTLITNECLYYRGSSALELGVEPIVLGSRLLVLDRQLGNAPCSSSLRFGTAKTRLGSISSPAKLVDRALTDRSARISIGDAVGG